MPIGKVPVAVKMPKSNTGLGNGKAKKRQEKIIKCQRQLMREEMAIMIHLQKESGGHPNVLKLIGAITTIRADFCILTEYCEWGSMDQFLRRKIKNGEFLDEIIKEENGTSQIWKVILKIWIPCFNYFK